MQPGSRTHSGGTLGRDAAGTRVCPRAIRRRRHNLTHGIWGHDAMTLGVPGFLASGKRAPFCRGKSPPQPPQHGVTHPARTL